MSDLAFRMLIAFAASVWLLVSGEPPGDAFTVFAVLAFVGVLWEVDAQVGRTQRQGGRRNISARVIEDSIHSFTGSRLTTMLLTYPRFVHAEFMTHRLFARNASSSRAIPSRIMRRLILENMAMPARWQQNRPGMQGGADLSPFRRWCVMRVWVLCGFAAVATSAILDKLKAHKQIVNRVVEPWGLITVVVTGTDRAWANFYALRDHPDADPTIAKLAVAAKLVHLTSTPRTLFAGHDDEAASMHLPFVTEDEREALPFKLLPMLSAARAARTSYLKHDGGTATVEEDCALYQRLVGSTPKHASPTEHIAQAIGPADNAADLSGCFGHRGWLQHRKTIPDEVATDLRAEFAKGGV